MRDEAVQSGLGDACGLLTEVDPLAEGLEGVVESALLGGIRTQDVGKQGDMANGLLSHPLEKVADLRAETDCDVVLLRPARESHSEKVVVQPFHVESEGLSTYKYSGHFTRRRYVQQTDSHNHFAHGTQAWCHLSRDHRQEHKVRAAARADHHRLGRSWPPETLNGGL